MGWSDSESYYSFVLDSRSERERERERAGEMSETQMRMRRSALSIVDAATEASEGTCLTHSRTSEQTYRQDCVTLCPLYSGCGRTSTVCGRWMPSN